MFGSGKDLKKVFLFKADLLKKYFVYLVMLTGLMSLR